MCPPALQYPESAETPSSLPVLVWQLPSAAVPSIRAPTVPSWPAIGSERRKAPPVDRVAGHGHEQLDDLVGRDLVTAGEPRAVHRLDVCSRRLGERSTVGAPATGYRAPVARRARRLRSISAKKLFEGTLVSSISLAAGGDTT